MVIPMSLTSAEIIIWSALFVHDLIPSWNNKAVSLEVKLVDDQFYTNSLPRTSPKTFCTTSSIGIHANTISKGKASNKQTFLAKKHSKLSKYNKQSGINQSMCFTYPITVVYECQWFLLGVLWSPNWVDDKIVWICMIVNKRVNRCQQVLAPYKRLIQDKNKTDKQSSNRPIWLTIDGWKLTNDWWQTLHESCN